MQPICCGIDVHQAQLTVCLRRVDTDGQVTQEGREVATTDDAVLTLSPWLTEPQCPVVALESTGVYWRPVYHVLVGTVEVLVGHAQEMRRRPGHKTDTADARWSAELLAHGLMRPRVVPPPSIGALRDLTRTRVALIQARTQAKNRVVKVLEETNLKRTSVVSDLFGRRGRRLLAALLAGERDPKTLAALALGVLRRKQSPLELALTGQLTEQHAWLIQGALERIDRLDRQLTDLDQHIGELMAPLAPQLEQLTNIPGVEATAARAILAEIGTEMRHCGSACVQGMTRVPASGARAARAQGIVISAGCSCRVPGPHAKPPPSSDTRVGVLRGASGAKKRRWPSPIKFW